MLRLLSFIVIFYMLFRVARFFIKVLLGSNFTKRAATSSQGSYQQQDYQEQKNSNIHIDYAPSVNKKKSKKSGFKGGEYVDFEEVN